MKKYRLVFLLVLPLCAQERTASRHILGFNGPVTAPSGRPARAIAQDFLETRVATELSLSASDIAGAYVAKEYQTAHNGVTHIVYKQQFNGIDVFNAEWVVNVAPDGSILNAGGTLFSAPAAGVILPPQTSIRAAARAAVRHMNPAAGKNFFPIITGTTSRRNRVRLAGGDLPLDVDGELVWYGDQGALRPAWLFYLTDTDGVQRYATIVDDGTQSVRAQQSLTFFQSPPSGPRGLVFESGSPQPNPTPGVVLTAAPPTVERTLQSFNGDPKASPYGWVTGNQTAGNNAVVGENLMGTFFLTTPTMTTAPDGNFSFPLQPGPGNPSPLMFPDAANVNLFYWMNRAHDLFYQYGFDEAAGNFQASNFGKGGTDGDPIYAYTHFGAQSPTFAQLENSFWTTLGLEDGSPSMVAMFLSQSNANDFFTDGAYDASVMIHEYTHGVSERLVRQGYSTFQGGAMGEAWSDFYGMEYLLPAGAPPNGVYPTGEYFIQAWGTGIRTRPYSTDMSIDPITYADMGHVFAFPDVHSDGEIWFEALWEMRANLIAQFGDAEGRRRVRMLVMDGMKLSIPAPSMVDMRDAILLADRVDFKGASQGQIWAAFAKRGLGALAYSSGGNTVHVVSSFELPSTTGQLKFYDDPIMMGEQARIILQDASLTNPTVRAQVTSSSGDLEAVLLHQQGSIYIGTLPTTATPGAQQNGQLSLATGDFLSAYYEHTGAPGDQLVSTTVASQLPYATSFAAPGDYTFSAETHLNMNGATFKRVNLPFQFPFFSNHYGSALVHTNGLISFDLPVDTSCTDSGTLLSFNAITPLWANLTTLGTAQPKEDVYMSQDAVSVTFHWIAETMTPSALTPGRPVDFAATLYSDGRIVFKYNQDSNADLNFDATYYGCGLGPILGISNGHDVFSQAFVMDTAGGGESATVHYDPPFNGSTLPVVTLEAPAAGRQAQGILTVSGIAYDTQAFISRVDIYIDNVIRKRTVPTVSRPDFCTGANASVNGCPRVGFLAQLDLSGLKVAPGDHTLFVRVTNSRAGFTDSDPVSFSTIAGQSQMPRGAIESPANGDTVSGNISVKGWALDDTLRITSADLLIDGLTNDGFTGISYGRARADICGALSTKPPNCPNVGFTVTIPSKDAFPALVDGTHTMMIRVRDESGRYTVLTDSAVTFTVKNGPSGKIVGVMSSPKNNDTLSGTVQVTGYAYVPGHKIIAAIAILDDAFPLGAAKVNQPAPDVCATLAGVDACPNIGFTFSLDTTHISNGPHMLGMELVDDAGEFAFIPSVISGGMNVTVQN